MKDPLDRVREAGDVRGVLLDLRGNGGGSTDGAADALGMFLPGCPLFPMKRRDGGIEAHNECDDFSHGRDFLPPLLCVFDAEPGNLAAQVVDAGCKCIAIRAIDSRQLANVGINTRKKARAGGRQAHGLALVLDHGDNCRRSRLGGLLCRKHRRGWR